MRGRSNPTTAATSQPCPVPCTPAGQCGRCQHRQGTDGAGAPQAAAVSDRCSHEFPGEGLCQNGGAAPLTPWLAQLLWPPRHPLAGALPQRQGARGSSEQKESLPPPTATTPPSTPKPSLPQPPQAAVTPLHASAPQRSPPPTPGLAPGTAEEGRPAGAKPRGSSRAPRTVTQPRALLPQLSPRGLCCTGVDAAMEAAGSEPVACPALAPTL